MLRVLVWGFSFLPVKHTSAFRMQNRSPACMYCGRGGWSTLRKCHLLKSFQVYSLCRILWQVQCSPELMMVKSMARERFWLVWFPPPEAPEVVQLGTFCQQSAITASQHLWNLELVQNYSNLHKYQNWELWTLCCDEAGEWRKASDGVGDLWQVERSWTYEIVAETRRSLAWLLTWALWCASPVLQEYLRLWEPAG